MNKAFEKIIERLKKEKIEWLDFVMGSYDKAIEIVNEVAEEFGSNEYEMGFEDGAESVRALAPYDDDWIPCSERLPEDGQSVVITDRNNIVRIINFSKWLYENPKYSHNIVPIAWMPLPQPYQPKGEQ